MVDRYAQLRSPISQWDLSGKQVFLRADLNVPIERGQILDSFRLEALLPTLKLLLDKGAKVTIGTHLSNKNDDVPGIAPLKTWLADHGYGKVTLLENLRFSHEERTQSIPYAQKLAHNIDFYVNDAFATCHRSDTSLVTLPTLFDANHRGIGLLIEKELTMLSKLKNNPDKPMLMILGGDKAREKQKFFEGLCENTTDFLLCPCWSELAQELMPFTRKKGIRLHVPQDYLVGTQGWDGPYAYKAANELRPSDTVIAIGSKTAQAWTSLIMQAKTIFVNGPMGDLSRPATTQELKTVLHTVTQAHAYRVVGGGSTVAALNFFNLTTKMDYCSTGGGATLAYIANQPLPALDALL